MDLTGLKEGRRGVVAKMISAVENDPAEARRIVREIFRDTGNAIVIGITGPAGAGKSSLINGLAAELKGRGTTPAILAIDPTSHVTGGAILGDRVRMTESTDSGTYIRSIASRGATGAISSSLRNSIRVLEYAGFDPIVIESVGAGQTEVEISNIADITIVVFNPHTGDSIQAIKAGLTEIGDIYVVNKSDLSGSSRLFDAVRDHIGSAGNRPLVFKTSAKTGRGIAGLADAIAGIMKERAVEEPGRGAEHLESEIRDIVLSSVGARIDEMLSSDVQCRRYVEMVRGKQMDPFEAADRILEGLA